MFEINRFLNTVISIGIEDRNIYLNFMALLFTPLNVAAVSEDLLDQTFYGEYSLILNDKLKMCGG